MAMNSTFTFGLPAFLTCRQQGRLDRLLLGGDAFRDDMFSWFGGVGSPGRREVRHGDG
jgi:hypothetical protein